MINRETGLRRFIAPNGNFIAPNGKKIPLVAMPRRDQQKYFSIGRDEASHAL
jgi:hypothetical protein